MGNFLTLNFWFNLRPGAFIGLSLKIMIGFILLLLVLAIISGIGRKRWVKSLYAGLWNSLYYFFLTNTIIGLVLAFFNYEMVPFLSARFWFLIWAISLIVWLFFIYKTIVKIPLRKARLEKEEEFKKYIP
ncbi:MAG: hypothetical protein Q7K35_04390 [bacterium]|nr:hypothetical protein [bacterium]